LSRIIYPGTFDPIHNGHIDIAARASKLFDELIFVVAVNNDKNPLLSTEERVELILDSTKHLDNVSAHKFTGLVVNYAVDCDAVAIIRGLRHVSDFEFEFQMAMMNYHLNSDIASLFMMPDEKYIHLNSTVVKDVVRLGGDIDEFVPKPVKDILLSKYSR
tara:strand:+ start:1655 stop:2134 length:480 start_codon:yes stop_codon:yes gene_type:complete